MKHFLVILLLFLSTSLWSQGLNYQIKGKITNQDVGTSEGGVKVTMLHNGSEIASTTTLSNGKYTLNASGPTGGLYMIVYSKSGFVTKKISFNGSNLNEEDLPAGDVLPFPKLDLDIFKERDNVDFSFLNNEPVAEFFWNDKKMILDFNKTSSAKVRNKINDLLTKADKDKQANEINYQKAITAADGFFNSAKYEEALGKYEEALGYKPTEAYPADKINELDALLQAAEEAQLKEEQDNAEYYALIDEADGLRDGGNLEGAVSKYQGAILLKSEQYPKDQVTALTAQITAKKKEEANQAAYDAAITAADGFMKQNSIRAAKDKYSEAIKLKPSEEYPKTKIAEIEGLMGAKAAEEAKKKKYTDAVDAADVLFDAANFEEAKTKYQEALTFESSASYVKQRIILCDTKIAELSAAKEIEEKIKTLLAEGKTAFDSDKLEESKGKYTAVLGLDDQNSIAITQIGLIDAKLEALKNAEAQDKQFNKLVEEGDAAVSSKDYLEGISKYEAAFLLRDDAAIKQKIIDAQGTLDGLTKEKEKEEEYARLIEEGTSLMGSDNLKEAKVKLEQALQLKPIEQFPKDKITEIDAALIERDNNLKRLANYDLAIKEANGLFDAGNWSNAKLKYVEALTFTDDKAFANGRISEIEEILNNEEATAKINAEIDQLLTEGSSLLSQSKLEEAKEKFEAVIKLDAANAVAQQKINEINISLAALKSDSEKEEAFNQLVSEGNTLKSKGDYVEAKAKYVEAVGLKDDANIRSKIAAIDLLLENEAEAEEIEANYNKLISDAKSFESSNDLNGALRKYKEALVLKPIETFPKEKIATIQAEIDASNVQTETDSKYNAMIAEAQTFEGNKDYLSAVSKYQAAALIKPDESLPKAKVKELQKLMSDNAGQAEKDKLYNSYMAKGDKLMAEENYIGAITEFNNALSVKPNEQEPVDKADEAEHLEKAKASEGDAQYEKILMVAEKKMNEGDYDRATELVERAIKGRPSDPRPNEILKKINVLRAKDKEYNELMAGGELLASSKKYNEAKLKFEAAGKIKPNESLPVERALKMGELANNLASSSQKQDLYDGYMSKGNKYQGKAEYVLALSQYKNALNTMPGDISAQNKINEIQQILDDLANANATDLANKNKFDAIVAEADGLFAGKTYLQAKDKYEEALKLIPSSRYVAKQIQDCERLERENSTVEAEREYQKIIKAADKNFNIANYDKAKGYYQRAIGFKPNDAYPRQKLAEIESIINPTTIASVELEDLGTPFDNSIMDGVALLRKAENERKSLNGTRMKSNIDDISAANSEMTTEKTKEHQENSNKIYAIQRSIEIDAGESDLNRQETVETLKESERLRSEEETSLTSFDKADNLNNQEVLNDITTEVAIDYKERDEVYFENSETMKAYNTALAEGMRVKSENESDENIQADQSISVIKYNVASKMNEDALIAGQNSDELKIIQENITIAEAERTDIETGHNRDADQQIAEVKAKIAVEQEGMNDNRVANSELIKEGDKLMAEANYNQYNDELEKYTSNKAIIDDKVESNNEVSELADASLKKKIEYVDAMDKKARVDYKQSTMSDEESRQLAKKHVDDSYEAAGSTSDEAIEKREENTEKLKDINKTIAADKSNQTIGEQEKHYDAAKKISDIDATPKKKIIVANELGEEYPEGVSQESFTQNDQNGLMTAIITRRIVVIEGHANVYIRTQTLHGITYSKNGKPSLQHVWNKETQGPNLERHY